MELNKGLAFRHRGAVLQLESGHPTCKGCHCATIRTTYFDYNTQPQCDSTNEAHKAIGGQPCWDGGIYIKVGDVPKGELSAEDPDHGGPNVSLADSFGIAAVQSDPMIGRAEDYRGSSAFEKLIPLRYGAARKLDPQTSKDAAKNVGGGKLIDLIFLALQEEEALSKHKQREPLGMTGKALAGYLDKPLNSITPRFAQLRRKGLIHAAGKRDKQIVWKLGNGVQR